MFKHAQLESVKAWIANPTQAALPLHGRVQRAIRQLILDGVLEVGRPLPSTRALAASLGVSRDTVESAYSQLHLEGFIERHVGRGSQVSKQIFGAGKHSARSKDSTYTGAPRLSTRGQAIFQSGGVRNASAPEPFVQGVPDTRGFPLPIWERLHRQVVKEHGYDTLLASPAQGTEALRHAIANYVNLERGAHATAERVLVLTSSQQALTLCANVLFDGGDQVFVEDPLYHGARKAFDAAQVCCTPIPVDQDGMQINLLQAAAKTAKSAAKAVFLTPSHQFPSGATLALHRRLAAIEWAQQCDGWIIEDDYDSEFHYEGKPTACVQGLDPHERTIYIGTFTKSLFPGLRIAYMVLPPALVKPMTVARTLLDGHSAPVPQLTLARFIDGGHFGAHIRSMRTVYAERRDALAHYVQQYLSAWVEPRIPAGGLQMPCILLQDIPEQVVLDSALRAGIQLTGLSALYHSQQRESGFLLGFAAYAPYEMHAAVRKLASVFRALTR